MQSMPRHRSRGARAKRARRGHRGVPLRERERRLVDDERDRERECEREQLRPREEGERQPRERGHVPAAAR